MREPNRGRAAVTLSTAVLDAMLAAGCTADQIVAAVKADAVQAAEADAARRERERLRKREQRASKKTMVSTGASDLSQGHSGTDRDSEDTLSSPEVSPQTPFPNPSNPNPPSPPKGGSSPAEFVEFWTLFPNKTGKADAQRKFVIARRKVDHETIMVALGRYVAKTDDRPWCNPSTWLHQERWDDQPATVLARAGPSVVPMKDTAANAARRRIEAIESGRNSGTGTTDDHQSAVGLIPVHAGRAGG